MWRQCAQGVDRDVYAFAVRVQTSMLRADLIMQAESLQVKLQNGTAPAGAQKAQQRLMKEYFLWRFIIINYMPGVGLQMGEALMRIFLLSLTSKLGKCRRWSRRPDLRNRYFKGTVSCRGGYINLKVRETAYTVTEFQDGTVLPGQHSVQV